jgi:hypothetical protein
MASGWSLLVLKLAWPLVRDTVASGVAPSEKVTVPLGIPAAASAEVTLAVKVTGCPNSGVDVLATSEVDVVDTPSLAHSAHTSEEVSVGRCDPKTNNTSPAGDQGTMKTLTRDIDR